MCGTAEVHKLTRNNDAQKDNNNNGLSHPQIYWDRPLAFENYSLFSLNKDFIQINGSHVKRIALFEFGPGHYLEAQWAEIYQQNLTEINADDNDLLGQPPWMRIAEKNMQGLANNSSERPIDIDNIWSGSFEIFPNLYDAENFLAHAKSGQIEETFYVSNEYGNTIEEVDNNNELDLDVLSTTQLSNGEIQKTKPPNVEFQKHKTQPQNIEIQESPGYEIQETQLPGLEIQKTQSSDNLKSVNLTNVAISTAKYGFVKACGAIPLIGNIAADIAQDIINLAENANHNREACKYISERVQNSLKTIATFPVSGNLEKSQKVYGEILNEIKLYVIEIDKPGKFSEKAKKWFMEIANADNIKSANEKLFKKLTDATNDFYNTVTLDTNIQINKIREEISEGFAALQIMLTQKGDSLTEEKIEVVKRYYSGDEVAVKKIPNVEQRKIAKHTKIAVLPQLAYFWLFINRFTNYSFGTYEEDENGKKYLFVVTKWMQHGNLHKNVLLDEYLDAKLTNFEMSRKIGDASQTMPLETQRLWTAPEKLKFPKTPYTDKCEVYSFAILLWEISAQLIPFNNIDYHTVVEKVKKGERPSPFSENTPEQYKKIVERAWHHIPKKRPIIDDLRKQLGKINREGNPNRNDSVTSFSSISSASDDSENEPLSGLLPIGQYMYAYVCLKGSYYSREEGLKYLKKAADNNDPDALCMVSQLFLNGEHGYPINDDKYVCYLKKAKEAQEKLKN
ncbi:34544_t:CDS:10 [Gigaspora margarita]|uniref:34544_t:CDS:1 n=1 Tax=Gigaspora margarita TaxID=4874 RepID=A0ABM8VX26_GIGMA|nr:34544_t:CDS:10 [Gigaspora margarita]